MKALLSAVLVCGIVAAAVHAEDAAKRSSTCAAQEARIAQLESAALKYRAEITKLEFYLRVADEANATLERRAGASCPSPDPRMFSAPPQRDFGELEDTLRALSREAQDRAYQENVLREMRRSNQLQESQLWRR